MKTDHELEDLLRATFASRAGVIERAASVPDVRRRHQWWPVLAAAAAVVLIAAGIVVGNRVTRTDHPTHPSPHPTATTTHTSAPTIPEACSTALPTAWKQAILASRLDFGSMAATLDDVASDGTLVVSRDFGVTPGSARDIVLVKPGTTPQVVYRVATPDTNAASAVIDGNWLVISVDSTRRAGPHVEPNFPPPTVLKLFVRDLITGSTRQITSVPPSSGSTSGSVIEQFTVQSGRVYWLYRPNGSMLGEVRSYDLQTGHQSTIYRGKITDYPQDTNDPIYGLFPSGQLPARVTANLDAADKFAVVTDGTAWAWAKSAHVVGWWQPGLSTPRFVQVLQDLTSSTDMLLAVAGPYVFLDQQVVDMRTGALASLVGGGLPSDKFASFEAQVGHAGTLYGVENAGTGHWVNGYWEDPQPQVQRVDTNKLPALHC